MDKFKFKYKCQHCKKILNFEYDQGPAGLIWGYHRKPISEFNAINKEWCGPVKISIKETMKFAMDKHNGT